MSGGQPAAVAFCPQPPLLVSEVGAGEPVAARAPSIAAVRTLTGPAIERIVVLGGATTAACFGSGAAGSFARYGIDLTVRLPGARDVASDPLPLSLAVGAWLLEQASWTGPVVAITCDADGALPSELGVIGEQDCVLVMGDGSARRTEKAPGWLDERAAGFDAQASAALAAGDPALLASIDLDLARELLAAGAPAWRAASGLLAGTSWQATVSYDDAPYGVGYLVATWSAPARRG
ncbi:MAG TPA: hypothetical protein VHZ96_00920 [Frankiaceae bacterium]|nr:hypothetical protein [Frankiaceae bacterium]